MIIPNSTHRGIKTANQFQSIKPVSLRTINMMVNKLRKSVFPEYLESFIILILNTAIAYNQFTCIRKALYPFAKFSPLWKSVVFSLSIDSF